MNISTRPASEFFWCHRCMDRRYGKPNAEGVLVCDDCGTPSKLQIEAREQRAARQPGSGRQDQRVRVSAQ